MTDADIDPRLRGKTYVVGVGVQKAGTTWLHDYLAGQPDIYMSERKEMHYFDARFGAKANKIGPMMIRQLKRHLEQIDDRGPIRYSDKFTELLDMVRMQYDEQGYPDYFARRVAGQKLFGEITPAYALIGEEGFSCMKRFFPRVKVIYLMRDPVERHHSMMRMAEDDRNDPGFATRSFIETLDRPFGRNMADYPAHIDALRKVFAPEEMYFGFYETLFTEQEIGRLCAFLDIPFAPAAYDTRLNKSSAKSTLDPALAAEARRKLGFVYDYCRKTFDNVPESWRA